MNTIKTVVFDLGGVLVDLDIDRCTGAFRSLGMDAVADLINPYYPAEMIGRLEHGDITFHEACEEMRRLSGTPDVPDERIAWAYGEFLVTIPVAKLRQIEALRRRVEHGVYGYATVPESYYGAVTSWFARRHSWAPGADWILPVTGVIPALSAILRALTRPGDRVLVLTPVYNHFFIAIDNSGCSAAECELTYGDNRYTVDFDALERRAADPAVKLMLLCNPHNPAGRVWTPEELRRIGDICLRRDILVVADEIHCELVMPGFRYTPFASLSEEFARRSVTCASPSKAFNLAGVQVANIFAADAGLRERIARSLEINETGMISPFAIEALTAAYTDGAEWLDALNGYLWENYLFLRDYFARHLPQFPVLPLEGTYLVWADCRAAGLSSDALTRRLLDEGRLHVNSGSMYGAAGEGFIRLNIACPRKLLAEGLDRLKRVLTT